MTIWTPKLRLNAYQGGNVLGNAKHFSFATCQVGAFVDLSEGVGLLEAQLLVKVVASSLLPGERTSFEKTKLFCQYKMKKT